MTSRGLVALLVRRWYLLLLGAVLTVAGTYAATHRAGVYWAGYSVVVLAPTQKYYDNSLVNAPYEMPQIAGVFVRQYNGAHPGLRTVSSDTRLYGEGERSAVRVRMVNDGSQWKPLYPVPVIDVQVVDPSPQVVAARSAETLARLEQLVQDYQDQADVKQSWRITTLPSSDAGITYHNGSTMRAAAATGALGISLSLTGIWWIDRLLLRRRRSASAAPRATTTGPTPDGEEK
ncbi:hypothetical protein SAMN04488544_0817 [Microlunatus sagamiharensis]|uniref:Capsular polysaccharide biosynthesis protein n=1 Tax=Microlunatus sagamiharensis TaxID=546874 RepID=A0A1H2LTM7_9ACTN|nr:hypothetical protein [Microlunatus sagamiharensis]SDU84299.1 hypothetical protein SAMN04488544_0817 [Microlunatus sagamiharensis]